MSQPVRGRATAAAHDLAFVDEAAFRGWYEAALPRVYGYLLRRTWDAGWAEDLTQQAFFEAVGKRSTFRGEADPVTWVIAIARRKLVDDLRRRDRRERSPFRSAVRPIADEPISRHDTALDVRRAVAALPALQRAAVVLCYVDGLPVRAAAELLGKSEKATESLLSRARATLRITLAEEAR